MDPTELNLNWTAPRCVNTRRGARSLSTATPNESFWEAYNQDKDALREAGITLSRDPDGQWQVCRWALPEQQEPVAPVSGADLNIPAPDGLAYMPFQRDGIAFLSINQNALLADQMGLGKSIMILGLLNLKPEIRNVLLICPASLKLNWRNEARKWLVRDTNITLIDGGKPVPINPGLTIINYDIVQKHGTALRKVAWDLIVCDEAHYLKGKSQRAKAVLGGGRGKDKLGPLPSKRFIALTGTPIPNRPIEIFPIMHRIAPAAFSNYYAFGNRFCDGKPGFGGSLDVSGASNLGELQVLLRSNGMIRRLKKDVLTELPDKTKQVIELPPSREIKRILDEELRIWKTSEETVTALRERREQAQKAGNETQFRELGSKLHDALTVRMQDMSKLRADMAELKAPYVVEYLKDMLEETKQVIVFCHHRSLILALQSAMAKEEMNPVVIHGEVNQADRQKAVDDFQAGRSRVFIGSIQAAGTGITLTASSTVLFAECDWTPGNMDQAADRAHRIGQKNNVLIQYLVMEQSLDAKMLQKVIGKADNIDRALDIAPEVLPVRHPELDLGLEGRKDTPLDRETKRREWIDKAREAGKALDVNQREAALQAIRLLHADNQDQAQERNGVGFNKFDTRRGAELAMKHSLDDDYDAGYALHLCRKYRNQIPTAHLRVLGLE